MGCDRCKALEAEIEHNSKLYVEASGTKNLMIEKLEARLEFVVNNKDEQVELRNKHNERINRELKAEIKDAEAVNANAFKKIKALEAERDEANRQCLVAIKLSAHAHKERDELQKQYDILKVKVLGELCGATVICSQCDELKAELEQERVRRKDLVDAGREISLLRAHADRLASALKFYQDNVSMFVENCDEERLVSISSEALAEHARFKGEK